MHNGTSLRKDCTMNPENRANSDLAEDDSNNLDIRDAEASKEKRLW